MALEVRFAGPGDHQPVAGLIEAMDRFYAGGSEDPDKIGEAVARWLSSDETDARIALAFDDGEAVGLAIFAILLPGIALSKLMFVKDLFVVDEARGRGVGEAIMRFLAAYCVDNGVGRIDLETERDNTGARRFYDRLGGDLMDWKIAYRFGPETLARLAE
jgi:GNAT superfamily N-acetyltransferase